MQFDIFFISYQEPNADQNWDHLRTRFPYAKRLHGIKGIHRAHQEAARLSFTDKFWVVDGDSQVVDDFDFVVDSEDLWADAVYVYRARNPVNGLEYGNAGIKLLPKTQTLAMNTDTTDMTTSISKNFFPQTTVASVTCFNTDNYNTWRSAFRECVKLASGVIEGQNNTETLERLNVWTTQARGDFADECLLGARAGSDYGTTYKNDVQALQKINDFAWLRKQYETKI